MTEQDEGSLQPTSDHARRIALLPDRPANVVADWLTAHPVAFRWILWGIVLAAMLTGVILWQLGMLEARNVGYGGLFVLNIVSSASIIVPFPGVAAACASAAPSVGLNALAIGFFAGAGSTIGEMTSYLAGYGGQSFVQKIKHYDKIHGIVVRRGAAAFFVLAILPLPVFDIAGIAAGSLGYPIRRFLLWVFLGKLIKFAGIAYACRYGIDWVMEFI